MLLDFLHLAQYQCHTSDTLNQLQGALSVFYDNKPIFMDLGAWEHFNIPKLHSLMHYVLLIHLFRTTNNYNTKQSECLHIDFANDAYCATNWKDVYSQMTAWLEHHERILLYVTSIIHGQHEDLQQPQTHRIPEPPCIPI